MLQKETKLGMTIGQLISIVSLLVVLFSVGIQANLRMSNLEIKQNENEVRIKQLEFGRLQNAENIEKIRLENREDHREIINKIDELILRNYKIDNK